MAQKQCSNEFMFSSRIELDLPQITRCTDLIPKTDLIKTEGREGMIPERQVAFRPYVTQSAVFLCPNIVYFTCSCEAILGRRRGGFTPLVLPGLWLTPPLVLSRPTLHLLECFTGTNKPFGRVCDTPPKMNYQYFPFAMPFA
jgi:hypothetical protein